LSIGVPHKKVLFTHKAAYHHPVRTRKISPNFNIGNFSQIVQESLIQSCAHVTDTATIHVIVGSPQVIVYIVAVFPGVQPEPIPVMKENMTLYGHILWPLDAQTAVASIGIEARNVLESLGTRQDPLKFRKTAQKVLPQRPRFHIQVRQVGMIVCPRG
jgi:hypothetical protein